MKAWHFIKGNTLRDGTTAPADGVTLKYTGTLAMCELGLHASLLPHQALTHASGATLCLVECRGEVHWDSDKLVCTERTIIQRIDATDMLRYYARMQALKATEYWEPPSVVLDYLMTGDESIRSAAEAAAWGAAWAAAGPATGPAAWAAAWAAARGFAAEVAAWAAARTAAGPAAWAAAQKEFDDLVYECFNYKG